MVREYRAVEQAVRCIRRTLSSPVPGACAGGGGGDNIPGRAEVEGGEEQLLAGGVVAGEEGGRHRADHGGPVGSGVRHGRAPAAEPGIVRQWTMQPVARISPLEGAGGRLANTLVVSCPDDLGSMHADLTKVRQALFNLLSNASKFTDHGTITLTVAQETAEPGPAWITFAVSDTGIGMTEEQLGRLFEAFS